MSSQTLERWREQGARIDYLSSHRHSDDVAKDEVVLEKHGFPPGVVPEFGGLDHLPDSLDLLRS